MEVLHLVLFAAIVSAVMQATLDRAGVGRVEATAPTVRSNALVMLSVPITLLSNLGLLVVTAWSFFVLPWLPTLGVVVLGFVGFSLGWGVLIATLRRSSAWYSVASVGVPVVFALRLACAACVVYLAFSFVQRTSL